MKGFFSKIFTCFHKFFSNGSCKYFSSILKRGSLETFFYHMKKTAGRKNLSFIMKSLYTGGYVLGKKWWLISRLPRGTVISRDKTSIGEFVTFDYIQNHLNPRIKKKFIFFNWVRPVLKMKDRKHIFFRLNFFSKINKFKIKKLFPICFSKLFRNLYD